METVDIWIGGAAGDGVQSTADVMGRVAARSGLHVFTYNSYQSAIRGGYTYSQVRVSTKKAWLNGDKYHIFFALNADSLTRHAKWAEKDAIHIYNSDRAQLTAGLSGIGIPISEVVPKPIMQNVVSLGAACAILGIPAENLEKAILDNFRKKPKEVQDANIAAARKGAELAKEYAGKFKVKTDNTVRLMMTGNQSIAFGAAQGGVRFYSAYPMTPATGILQWLTDHSSKLGLVVEQAEDEIAVINMAIGASFSGARSMCATSGGGFALMTEAVGLSAMAELPLVAVNVMRAGPSTGVPTKTEQSDLFQVLGAGQGDAPKAVVAPLNLEDCFYLTQTALNLADKYQLPVTLVSDLLLSEHSETTENLDTKRIPIDRGAWAKPGAGFKRYMDTDTGVSPRTKPGTDESLVYTASSDEHDERGHLISDVATNPVIRKQMMEKRMRKMGYLLKDMPPNVLFGDKDAQLTLVGWGSTYNLLRALVERGQAEGMKLNALAIRSIWPFLTEDVLNTLKGAKNTLMIENNFQGQMARLIRQETGFEIAYQCLKYDGEPFYLDNTWEYVKKVYQGKAEKVASLLTPYGLP